MSSCRTNNLKEKQHNKKIRKRGCSSSTTTPSSSSLARRYRFKRTILVGKKGGYITPAPMWKTRTRSPSHHHAAHLTKTATLPSSGSKEKELSVSARKLAATLWEINDLPPSRVKKEPMRNSKEKGIIRSKDRAESLCRSGLLEPHMSDPPYSPFSERMKGFEVDGCKKRVSDLSHQLRLADHYLRGLDTHCSADLMEVYLTEEKSHVDHNQAFFGQRGRGRNMRGGRGNFRGRGSHSFMQNCPTTRRSTTGFCIFFGSHCISWASKKQPTVSRSSAEAEYRALATTAAELTWLQYLLHDLGIQLEHRPLIFCDNQSAIHMSRNPVFHARTKHIAIDYHFIREKVTAGDLRLRYLPTAQQIADVFTKPLPKDSFSSFRHKLGVHSLSLPSLRGGVKNPNISTSSHALIVATDQDKYSKESWNDIKPLEANLTKCTALIHGVKPNQLWYQKHHPLPLKNPNSLFSHFTNVQA